MLRTVDAVDQTGGCGEDLKAVHSECLYKSFLMRKCM